MSKARIVNPFDPYEVGLLIADAEGADGHTFVDPLRFAQLVEEGFAEVAAEAPAPAAQEPAVEPAATTPAETAPPPAEPAADAAAALPGIPPRRAAKGKE